MRIALIDTNRHPARLHRAFYPVGLLRLAAWRKQEGDEVALFDNALPEAGVFDEAWISTVFTFDIPYASGIVREAGKRVGRVRAGGIAASLLPQYFERLGADVHPGLVREAEGLAPDWTLLPEKPDYSIVNTSRGCVRACSFCAVTRLEGKFRPMANWTNQIIPGTRTLIVGDNNWLAKSPRRLREDVEALQPYLGRDGVLEVDFNQGLDARLLTGEKLEQLMRLPVKAFRFAFDSMGEHEAFERAVRMAAESGARTFYPYVLYNHEDYPVELYRRVRICVELQEELNAKYQLRGGRVSIAPFPMLFTPLLEVNPSRSYVGRHWTDRQRRGVGALTSAHWPWKGISCCTRKDGSITALDEFEFFFGKSEDEFARMLAYPKLRDLLRKRVGAWRQRTG